MLKEAPEKTPFDLRLLIPQGGTILNGRFSAAAACGTPTVRKGRSIFPHSLKARIFI